MLRVCGVTYDHTTNYGSSLQAFALQYMIEKTVIAGDNCSYRLIPAALFPKNVSPAHGLKNRIKTIVKSRLNAFRRKRFEGFEDRYMHYASCSNPEELTGLNEQTDAFVCGSDVVWNLNLTQGKPLFFLDFAEKYKFSYAASFGVMDIHKDFNHYRGKLPPEAVFGKYLPGLDQISVREESAVEIVKNVSGRDAVQVCDPVLLLSKEEWSGIAAEPKRRKPYIFAYSTYTSPNYLAFLEKIKSQTGLPVINVTWRIKESINNRAFFVPTPEEWLRLLMDAEYVVTNSFHGTAFCVLFNKPFYCVMRDKEIRGTRVRLYDFTRDMGLVDRVYGDTPGVISLAVPDFTQADRVLEEQRRKSLQFLRENLEAAYRKSWREKETPQK